MSTHHEGSVSIWFFIGISLLVNGILICGAGVWEVLHPPANPTIVLFNLHANVWWGGVLAVAGLVYTVFFIPGRGRS
jgi:hypothetical protein